MDDPATGSRPFSLAGTDLARQKTLIVVLGVLFLLLLIIVVLPSLTSLTGLVFQLAAISLAVVGMLFGFLVLRRLNLRLDRLAGVAQSIGAGDLTARSEDEGNDAVSRLAASINSMAEQIQTSIRDGDQQREALADREARLEEQNVELKDEQGRRASFGEFLTAINTVELDSITRRGLEFVTGLADAQLAVFYLLDSESGELQRVSQCGIDAKSLQDLSVAAPRSGMPVEVLKRRQWMSLRNVDVDMAPPLDLGFGSARIREVVGIPVLFQRDALGVIVLAAIRVLNDQVRAVVANAVEALGGAVNNAITYKTVQRQALHLEVANRELRQADRLRSEFVANMSHELRTPLNSVIGFSHLLGQNRGKTLSESDLGFVEKINRNGRHLLGLINDILDLSKIEAGRMELDVGALNLRALAAEVMDMLEPQAQTRQLSLRMELPAALPEMLSDVDKLKQVLINLLGNAIKFTHQGEVTLEIEQTAGDRLLLHVQDTGIGIPADRLDGIFEPFRQADSGTTREYGGTGLGLSISRALIEMMQGDIRVESEEGVGTRFTVELPVRLAAATEGQAVEPAGQRPDAAPAPAPEPDPGPAPAGTVLVVDHQVGAREALARRIRGLGLEVREARSGDEALRLAPQVQPKLITLDVMMPEMDGWQVLAALKEDKRTAHIPVVMVSLLAERRRALALGAAEVLTKPAPEQELKRLLMRYAGLRLAPARLMVFSSAQRADRARYTEWLGQEPASLQQFGADEAPALSDGEPPDGILLEDDLGDAQVYSLLERIRGTEHFADVPVAVLRDGVQTGLDETLPGVGVTEIRTDRDDTAQQIRELLAGA